MKPVIFSTILFLIAALSCNPDTKKETVPADTEITPYTAETAPPHPSWVPGFPMVMVGNWDAMPLFSRRRGGEPEWQEEDYRKQHSEETVIKLKEMGATLMMLHFFKGYGLEAEKEHIEEAKQLARLCEKHGLRVGVYVGNTISYETFLAEEPDATDWFAPDYLGKPIRYPGTQTFRKRVYFMHPGYIAYMKRVVKNAIEDVGADYIHFDNTNSQGQHAVFFHPMAIDDFRTYLKNKYTPEQRKERFGFREVRYMLPPKWDRPLSTIDDPLFQEWTDFRCQKMADYFTIMRRYIYELDPEVAVHNNPNRGLNGANTMWYQSIDMPRLKYLTDFIATEEGNSASVNKEGVLISRIRTYKMTRTLDKRLTAVNSSKLELAESMAYNRQGVGIVNYLQTGIAGLPREDYTLHAYQQDYIRFFHDNFDYYRDIQHMADVAVLHTYATMAYNNDRPYESTFLFEQALIQEKIPFDIIFDDNLKDLSKYRVLVLADQECLNDEQLELVRDFVNRGGGLVATGTTSLYTEWRQRKRDFGLKDLFRVEAPEWHGRGSKEDILAIPVQKNQVGKGKVVYIPSVTPSVQKPPAALMTSQYWKLPVNWNELIESVQWASGNNLSLAIEAPQTVTMELVEKEDHSAMILHLLNYNDINDSVNNIKVDVLVPEGKRVTKVSVLTPDGENEQNLQFSESGERIVFTVPQLLTYNMIAMKLE
ncbi:MAG: hypothetical protein ABFS38_03975 [Bacteroidota bacterium]